MKYTFWICLALITLKSCAQEFRADRLEQIVYTVSSRGYFIEVVATPSLLTIQKGREASEPKSRPMPTKEWKAIAEEVSQIDLKALENMETDTDHSSVDRAAMAEISILYAQEEYVTPSFDEGTPPKALETLVNKLLVLAGSVE
jgi:hypothetical protein